jgi:hypothetical protein
MDVVIVGTSRCTAAAGFCCPAVRTEERVLGVVARLLYWLSENDARYAPAYGNLLLPLMQRASTLCTYVH